VTDVDENLVNKTVTNILIVAKITISPKSCFNNHKDLVALEKEAALKKVSSGTQVDFRIISRLLIG